MTGLGRARTRRLQWAAITLYTGAALVLAAAVFVPSLGWIDRTFPGFLLMDNRVVPSIGLDHWTGIRAGKIYQRELLAIDDTPVTRAADAYARVAAEGPGTPFRYELRAGAAADELRIDAMRFTLADYASLFGALLLNGIIFTAVGVAVWILGPPVATTVGTVVLTLTTGAFCLTAMDLYGPARLFRLHVATEALLPAALLHLALVFPVARLGRYRRPTLAVVYLLDLVLVALYQINLYEPLLYSAIHNFCMAACGLATIALIVSGVQAYYAGTSLLVRRRLGIVLVGTVAGFALPAWLLTVSALSGGDRAINLAAFTAPLFPLSLAYAVVKLDLFEIDAMLRRAINYLLLTGMVAGAYALLVLGLGFVLQTASLASSPAFPLIFSLLMLVLFNPLRERLQRAVDRVYDRTSHNAQKTLERASGALVATLNLEDIYELTIDTIRRALLLDTASLWLAGGRGDFVAIQTTDGGTPAPLAPEHPLLARLRRGRRAVSIHDFGDGDAQDASARACRDTLAVLGADLVLPLRVRDDLIGMLALGKKRSGRLFTLDDLDFLSTFVNQAVVAILNARSYRKVEELNVGLEHKVAQRTGELAATNQELGRSLAELGRAYDDLQRSQENLVRAEKMAALGRLTAGIAHEINTPLGAALNSLKVLGELADEYALSIGDPNVDERDHRELAAELRELVGNVATWTGKAAGYIRSIKAHTRTMGGVEERSFDVAQLIEDTRRLLAHRLRISSCTVVVECPPGVIVYGDPGKLGQVLTNLITNAVDAYEDQGAVEGPIRIGVQASPERVEIAVEDRGCGVAPENLERIFEELFTTKPPGKGTGLGLPISRDIVSDCFGGRILVASAPGRGSRFTVVIPHREPGDAAAEPSREHGVVIRDSAPL